MPTWNRGTKGHEHNSSDGVFEANGAAEMRGQVPGHSCQHANKGNGHKEAGPAIPVLSGGDKSEENFPENRQEVHNVVKAGWQALLAALLLIIVTWQKTDREELHGLQNTHTHSTAAASVFPC